MMRDGLVSEKKAWVQGNRQRVKTYDLTFHGRSEASALRRDVLGWTVNAEQADGSRASGPIGEFVTGPYRGVPLVRILQTVAASGGLPAPDSIRGIPHGTRSVPSTSGPRKGPISAIPWVEMLSGSPRTPRFTGRSQELEWMTSSAATPRMIVVHGVAGIGKSWLAAEACGRLRGTRNLFWHHVRPWDSWQSVLFHLGEFLAALGRPNLKAVMVRNRTERAVEILSQDLPGTQAFLVFDDAHQASPEARQVFRMILEALTRATDVRVVLLTRRRLPTYDRREVALSGIVREVHLGGLEMTEVLSILSAEGGPWTEIPVARESLRHPLLLELCRAHRSLPSMARADVRQFLEETILRELSETERRMMGVASLYEVSVPREALFLQSSWGEDVLRALQDRELLRATGEERYEIHDTVRDFFLERLTPGERRVFRPLAARELGRLAEDAWTERRFGPCADYLSNATRIADLPTTRAALEERLGEALSRMGDLLALSVAFRRALKDARTTRVRRRLHRKLGMAYAEHGELEAALREAHAAHVTRGGPDRLEEGWLELLQARVANRRDLYWKAEAHARKALATFRESGDASAEARASLELAYALSVPGTTDAAGHALADRYYRDALRLAPAVDDPWFRVRVHTELAARRGQVDGNAKAVAHHLEAVESIPGAAEDPFVRADVLDLRAWSRLVLLADFRGAETDAREAIRLAGALHNSVAVAEAKLSLIGAVRGQGRLEEAAALSEEDAWDMLRLGFNRDRCMSVLLSAGECHLIRADRDAWDRLLAEMKGRSLASNNRYPHAAVFEAYDRLLKGDDAKVTILFDRALRDLRKSATEHGLYTPLMESGMEFHYAIALAALGRKREASEHRERALETFRLRNYRNRMTLAAERERQILGGIERLRKTGGEGATLPRHAGADSVHDSTGR